MATGAWAAPWVDTFDGGIEGWETDSDPRGGTPEDPTPAAVDIDSDGDTEIEILGDGSPANATDYLFTDDANTAGVLYEATDPTGLGDFTSVNFGAGADPTVRYVTFDFWANADKSDPEQVHEPAALEFYFLSGSTYWRYVIHDDVTPYTFVEDGMTPLSVALSEGSMYSTGGSETWANSIQNVEEIGIIISYQSWGGQEYGIDNFELHNPEPGTYAVLAFALVSLGVTFRGKLRTGLKGLLRK
jgi:hypothetical protein